MQLMTKIKFDSDHRTTIHMDDTDDEKLPKEVVIKSQEGMIRHPDFDAAMLALLPLSLAHYGFPITFNERTELKTINLKRHDSKGLGFMPSVNLKFEDKITGVCSLSLPEIHEDLNETGSNKMPIQIHDALMTLLNEAQAFLGGKFAQADLFAEEEENEEQEETADA